MPNRWIVRDALGGFVGAITRAAMAGAAGIRWMAAH
jgi:hypothetical protein